MATSPRSGSEGLAGRSPESVERDCRAALERAASGTSVDEAEALDGEVGGLLENREVADAVLARLPLENMAGLLERVTARLPAGPPERLDRDRRIKAWAVLDLLRRSSLLRRIPPAEREAWASRILAAVDASHLTIGPLFRQRVDQYGSKVLFQTAERGSVTWRQAGSRVDFLARCLLALDELQPVAILSDNRLETALVDLACLTSGIENVMIPGTATDADVEFILDQAAIRTVVVSDAEQLGKVLRRREAADGLRIVTLDTPWKHEAEALPLTALGREAERIDPALPARRGEAIDVSARATVMYTSGTTGTPKGIQFSHRNIVFKRFARALALPELGEDDVFLCLLPLYHTFGRYLEMLGCVFWGATYTFLGGTSAEALLAGMRRHRPTVFISVPKKWLQLREAIAQRADPVSGSDEELGAAVRQVTGGRLRWGLSAAGYLDPDVFRLFQRYGVELLSGFGMTEATGGITMTPPGEYRENSLGTPLPGIAVGLEDDGEMVIRGPYVMLGYVDSPEGEAGFDAAGWFHTGDLMERDADGHYRLVDRKKEIYKNVRGETIAPQRVENLFRDFESVGRAFLVGDHRDFNTLLIWPDPDYARDNFASRSPQQVREHFRSLVVSVNKFLAPYERIVDFAVLDRDLDAEHGELTPKGTPRRRVVERTLLPVIRQLYRRTDLNVGGAELTFPNWLFQALGLTAQDLAVGPSHILLPHSGARLTVRRHDPETVQIGSYRYRHGPGALNIGVLLTTPRLWLGNEELVRFVPLDLAARQRPGRAGEGIEPAGRLAPYRPSDEEREVLRAALRRSDWDLDDLDGAARLLGSFRGVDGLAAIELLERVLAREETPLTEPARLLLARAAASRSREVRRRALRVLIPVERDAMFLDTLRRFVAADPGLLGRALRAEISEIDLSQAKIDALLDLAQELARYDTTPREEALPDSLLQLVAAYGAAHPVQYQRLRAFLVRTSVLAASQRLRSRALTAASELEQGFRHWLGATSRIDVDPETGREYRWDEVVVFDEDVPRADRLRLLAALRGTALLREAVFLFHGASVRLSDVPPGGVWVRLLASRHGKSVYRVTVQTRFQGHYELAVNVNHDLPAEQVQEEIRLLILSGESPGRDPLVEHFGGYWAEQDLWSEEFISGETLDHALRRLSRRDDGGERVRQVWPFLAWATLAAWVDFWHRSGGRLELADPGLSNVVVPTEDYQVGARIVSLSRRRPHRRLLAMMRTFRQELLEAAESQYPTLRGILGWDTAFAAVLEVLGERGGVAVFREALAEETDSDAELREALGDYLARVEEQGYVPLRMHFAVERYRRWAALSVEPTPEARARTLAELYETYGLQRLAADHPETRVRFYRRTVLSDVAERLGERIDAMIRRLREGQLAPDDLIEAVDEMRAETAPGHEEEYFLARMSYPYLRPEVRADFVRSDLGGRRQSEIVVALEDHDANLFRVRHAINPKEVERLHRLFVAAKLDVRFHMDHRYLVALNDREQIIAGIYYEIDESGSAAHLEKIVVADRYRRKGVADGLMHEFLNRLRAAGVKTVTTGFFRPEYFYGFGFRIEKRYAGLVKSLESEDPPARPALERT